MDSEDRLLSRLIDKRLAWVVEYPMEPGRVDDWLVPSLDPSYVPPTKIAPSQSIILIDALTGKVLMMSGGG